MKSTCSYDGCKLLVVSDQAGENWFHITRKARLLVSVDGHAAQPGKAQPTPPLRQENRPDAHGNLPMPAFLTKAEALEILGDLVT